MHLFFLIDIITNLLPRDLKQLEATMVCLPPFFLSLLSFHILPHPFHNPQIFNKNWSQHAWKEICLILTGFYNLASFYNINCTHMCYSAFFVFYRWHSELGPVVQQSFCMKPDSNVTGAMHHHTPLRIMLCCVYKCLPSSWFLNMGAGAWHVLEIGICLLLCSPNEANCILEEYTAFLSFVL